MDDDGFDFAGASQIDDTQPPSQFSQLPDWMTGGGGVFAPGPLTQPGPQLMRQGYQGLQQQGYQGQQQQPPLGYQGLHQQHGYQGLQQQQQQGYQGLQQQQGRLGVIQHQYQPAALARPFQPPRQLAEGMQRQGLPPLVPRPSTGMVASQLQPSQLQRTSSRDSGNMGSRDSSDAEAEGGKGGKSRKPRVPWSDEEVYALIELVGPIRAANQSSNTNWVTVATKLHKQGLTLRDSKQVADKFNALRRSYTRICAHNQQSGNAPYFTCPEEVQRASLGNANALTEPVFKALHAYLSTDAAIHPPVTAALGAEVGVRRRADATNADESSEEVPNNAPEEGGEAASPAPPAEVVAPTPTPAVQPRTLVFGVTPR